MKADHYDSIAESYSTENESSLENAYYERPAMIDLAGDVNAPPAYGHTPSGAGRRVTRAWGLDPRPPRAEGEFAPMWKARRMRRSQPEMARYL
jgi:hypothetical protein